MSVLDELEWVTRAPPDDHDNAVVPEPGLDAVTIHAIERRVGAPLPTDLRTLLGACHGIRGLAWEVDFTGSLSFEMAEMFPHGPPIVGDHTGNFWVVDCLTTPEAEAAVFFACHDPPVVLWQCRGMTTFLREMGRTFVSREQWAIIDLRAATPGTGFSWGRCGYPTGLRRHGEERLFACAAPKRGPGILSRLFGR